jgi:hypothetical protein
MKKKMSVSSTNYEEELYNEIVQKYIQSEKQKELWKNRIYIRLMNDFEKINNPKVIKNAIILMLSLFENIPPDIYNTRGKKIEEISMEKKEVILKQLRKEYS